MAVTAGTAGEKSTPTRRALGPYSRRLHRGAIGDSVDGRSTLGRLMRHLEAELVAHCGGKPSITQKMLIERAVKIRVQLDLLDEKVASGAWTAHDSRTYGGLLNAYRLTVRELGMAPATPRQPTLAETLAEDARHGREQECLSQPIPLRP